MSHHRELLARSYLTLGRRVEYGRAQSIVRCGASAVERNVSLEKKQKIHSGGKGQALAAAVVFLRGVLSRLIGALGMPLPGLRSVVRLEQLFLPIVARAVANPWTCERPSRPVLLKKRRRVVLQLDDATMRKLASKMADTYSEIVF